MYLWVSSVGSNTQYGILFECCVEQRPAYNSWFLHLDTTFLLRDFGPKTPSYCFAPDLALCDFWLFLQFESPRNSRRWCSIIFSSHTDNLFAESVAKKKKRTTKVESFDWIQREAPRGTGYRGHKKHKLDKKNRTTYDALHFQFRYLFYFWFTFYQRLNSMYTLKFYFKSKKRGKNETKLWRIQIANAILNKFDIATQ